MAFYWYTAWRLETSRQAVPLRVAALITPTYTAATLPPGETLLFPFPRTNHSSPLTQPTLLQHSLTQYCLAVAILAYFTARQWRLAVPTVASWRLAAVLEGPGGGPYGILLKSQKNEDHRWDPSKEQKRKERIYSHYFLTKDNEDRFQVVMQRKLVAERKVILKPGEVNEFQLELIRRGWERLGSYPSTFSVTLVKEFYANAKVTTSAAPTFLSYVRGKRVPFDADMINEFLGTQLVDDVECQFSVLDDEGVAPGELIQALCLVGGGFHRDTIQRGSLHPLARFWSAFVHANISPCSHVSDLTEGRTTILYTILTGRVMDVGQFIANEIHRCANAAGKAALSHPSLIIHLCSLAGVDIFVPPLEKATQDLDFSYFQRFCSVAPRPRRITKLLGLIPL
ncbi:hypothetical protein DEO72_LG11g1503 [Vigna unguiculata]|uniref:Putative plant transposon protein domain-containing protein n=1 Tax=Vigna unguiculata TaxID=3917 RepID=A0A4D6NNB5_VIGUN|nr:hypothetical protein DEO72_LG11g1503 [Vigna unguiculata]